MASTDGLRKLLEERVVEWWETVNDANCVFTWWESPTFGTVHAMDNDDGKTLFMACLNNRDFTPEQAIAATLGGGKCELVYGENDHGDDGWWCQSCGGWFAASFRHTGRNNIIEPRFCQHCGKAVKR